MSLLRIVGATMVIGSCGALGGLASRGLLERFSELRAFRDAFELLETEISYRSAPLPEVFLKLGKMAEVPVSQVFSHSHEVLAGGTGKTAQEAWSEALGRALAGSSLGREDRALLFEFGRSVGVCDKTSQLRHIAYTKHRLEAALKRAEEDKLKNSRLWKYLGLGMGLVIAISLY